MAKNSNRIPWDGQHKISWVVEHEFDNDPTFVVERFSDPEGYHAIEFPASLPVPERRAAARRLADILQEMGVRPTDSSDRR